MSKSKLSLIVLVVVLVVVGGGWYYYSQSLDSAPEPVKTGELSEEDQQKLLSEVGKLILLPADEKPSIAVVDNADLLSKSQLFFKDVVNGDQVLIYSSKAIIYRPSTNLIVNVGPVQRNDDASAPGAETGTPSTPSETSEVPTTPPSAPNSTSSSN